MLKKYPIEVSKNDTEQNVLEIVSRYYVKEGFVPPDIVTESINKIMIGDIKITEKPFGQSDMTYYSELVKVFNDNVMFYEFFIEVNAKIEDLVIIDIYDMMLYMDRYQYIYSHKYDVYLCEDNIYVINGYDKNEIYLIQDKYKQYFLNSCLKLQNILSKN